MEVKPVTRYHAKSFKTKYARILTVIHGWYGTNANKKSDLFWFKEDSSLRSK